MTTGQGFSGPFWPGCCLLLMLHKGDLYAPHLGKDNFLGSEAGPQGLLLVLCVIEQSSLLGLSLAFSTLFLPAGLVLPRYHMCPGSLWPIANLEWE